MNERFALSGEKILERLNRHKIRIMFKQAMDYGEKYLRKSQLFFDGNSPSLSQSLILLSVRRSFDSISRFSSSCYANFTRRQPYNTIMSGMPSSYIMVLSDNLTNRHRPTLNM